MSDTVMRAIRFHAYGGPEQLVLEQVPRPVPGNQEVLVRVHAAGVNPVDWKIRQGWMQEYIPLQLPAIPGHDIAGVVAAVGPGVATLQEGMAVYGRATGTYADYALAPASDLIPKPAALSFDEAATVPLGALTAWQALFDHGGLQAGQHVLIHAAAGGVGSLAVQLARWRGAEVIGTASADNAAFVRDLGAQMVIDYQATPFETVVRDVDVVLDTLGGEVQTRSWPVLRPGGILVSVAAPPASEEAEAHGVRSAFMGMQFSADELRQVSELIETGQLKPVVGATFTLDDAARAHLLSQGGHGRGRIILHVAD